jgi:hypothetical protein
LPEAEVALTRAYLRWCERTGRPGDCLRLLVESLTINGDGRYALGMALAQGVVLEEMMEAFKDMADPQAMLQAVLWTWTTYMILLAVPEPFSKGLAAAMTLTLIGYVGYDTFWSLIMGFKRLVDEADQATTFENLHPRVSALYSSIRRDITGSRLTVRQWLSTQSYEAQRKFGLRTIENIRKGIW